MAGFWNKVWHLYYDGFRNMTIGRTLWTVILVKLFIMFFILRLFFFPNYIKQHAAEGKEADFVATGIGLTESTEKTEGTEGIYNLNGQQLSAPQRGINIIGGKKVLVK